MISAHFTSCLSQRIGSAFCEKFHGSNAAREANPGAAPLAEGQKLVKTRRGSCGLVAEASAQRSQSARSVQASCSQVSLISKGVEAEGVIGGSNSCVFPVLPLELPRGIRLIDLIPFKDEVELS